MDVSAPVLSSDFLPPPAFGEPRLHPEMNKKSNRLKKQTEPGIKRK
jgi:hypothetical protein